MFGVIAKAASSFGAGASASGVARGAAQLSAKPGFNAMKNGLGTLPQLNQINAGTIPLPNVNNYLKGASMAPQSAGMNSIQAAQTPSTQDADKANLAMAASTLAAAFVEAGSRVELAPEDSSRFVSTGEKILEFIKKIEEQIIDEQDTSIVHASGGAAPTTIVQSPFLPTEAPVPEGNLIAGLLSLAGGLVAAVGYGIMKMWNWLGSLWRNFASKLMTGVKEMFDIGWSKVMTGFKLAGEWASDAVRSSVKWAETCMATTGKMIGSAVEHLKGLAKWFDLGTFDITKFNLAGLWDKMKDLEVFGSWGKALKGALNLFGGTGLDTLKFVFDIAGKVWNAIKPIASVIGKCLKFLGPIGILFGLKDLISDAMNMAGDIKAIIGAKDAETRALETKNLMRTMVWALVHQIPGLEWVLGTFGITEQKETDKENLREMRNSAGIKVAKKSHPWSSTRYEIANWDIVSTFSVSELETLVREGDLESEDKAKVQRILDEKIAAQKAEEKGKTTQVSNTYVITPELEDEPSLNQSLIQQVVHNDIADIVSKTFNGNYEYDQTVLNSKFDYIREQLENKYVKTGLISHTSFTAEFNVARSRILEAITNHNNSLATSNVNTSNTIAASTIVTGTTDGTLNVSTPTNTRVDDAGILAQALSGFTQINAHGEAASQGLVQSFGPPPEAGTPRAAAAAKFATQHAHAKSTGYCARYVRRGLEAAGYKFQSQPMAYMYASKGILQGMGFTEIDRKEPPKVGDISVMGPRYNGHAGHIAIYNGRNWVSDFLQRGEQIYAHGPYPIWVRHFRDTGTEVPFDPTSYMQMSATAAPAVPLNQANRSMAMASTINTNPDNEALKSQISQISQNQQSSSQPDQPRDKDNTNLTLDQLLHIPNEFS